MLKLVTNNGPIKRTPRPGVQFRVYHGNPQLEAVAAAVAALKAAYDSKADLAKAREEAAALLAMYAEEARKHDALTRR